MFGKNILKIVFILVVGGIGGILSSQIIWPYLVERPLFYKYRLDRSPVYVTEKKEIIIQENTALQDAVEKTKKSIVGIKSKNSQNISGTGLIITADGLMVTLSQLVPQSGSFTFYVDNKTPNWQIIKRDVKNNLVLIKLEGSNYTTVGFNNFNDMRIGERVFLLIATSWKTEVKNMVNEGIISFLAENKINANIPVNILNKSILSGSVLFNIKGEAIGIAFLSQEGIDIIPIQQIRDFAGI